MNPSLVAIIIAGYFLVLILISWFTSRNADSESFYTGNRQSPWFLVAFGMIGASLSGVTFISVPGEVGNSSWFYFQMVLGYLLGYFVIAMVLLPLYYRLNLVSIYGFLEQRFGFWAYKSGAFFFLVSRVIGAAFRLFLVAGVLQIAFFDAFGLPFWVSVVTAVLLIWIYTFRGGIKTIVWTDTLQTTFMILSVIVSIYFIKDSLDWSWGQVVSKVWDDSRSDIFIFDWQHSRNFFKQFFAGAFIAIVMTGLDQDMMQKNLTCKNLKEAQKNVFWFSTILVFVNLLFLALGVLLYQYADAMSIALPERSDSLFPMLAVNHFNIISGVVFLLGITAAAYSSADSALTALTTSFCVDFLGFNAENFEQRKKMRVIVHLGFSILLIIVILVFDAINSQSVINSIFTAAGYTYGPLLGMFTFGIYTQRQVTDKYVPMVCLAAPILSYLINLNSETLLGGYQFGFEIVILNGLLTFIGLSLITNKAGK
ncbi:MAG: sodium:solute symporter [Cyclobacteriaceae bacterium]